MLKYGQYCPLARALELLGDRWTLLIIRDIMKGIHHFNDLERGLPGISRGLLSKRLKHLQMAGIVEKRYNASGRNSTEYHLTEAGHALEASAHALWLWGTQWAFGDPSPEELDSVLLMWWVYRGVKTDQLPDERVVVQFDFYGAETATYWLVLTPAEVNLCLTDPGFDIDLLVTADLSTFFKLWAGRISYYDAVNHYNVNVEGMPGLIRAFPRWFEWNELQAAAQTAASYR